VACRGEHVEGPFAEALEGKGKGNVCRGNVPLVHITGEGVRGGAVGGRTVGNMWKVPLEKPSGAGEVGDGPNPREHLLLDGRSRGFCCWKARRT